LRWGRGPKGRPRPSPFRQAVLRLGVFLTTLVAKGGGMSDGTADLDDFKDDLQKYVITAGVRLRPPAIAAPDLGGPLRWSVAGRSPAGDRTHTSRGATKASRDA